jgi:hypothetical protein
VTFDVKVVNILKEQQYQIYNDELPVILVNEVPVCKVKIVEQVIRDAIIQQSIV